jgi:cation diffusion facilitator family transporter
MAHFDSPPQYSKVSSGSEAKLQVAWRSLFVSLFLVASKLVVGLATGSLAILSQAADSAFDSFSVLVTLLAVRISAAPPDEDHPYGHGKFENLSALLESLFLFGLTIWIGIEAVTHIAGSSVRTVEVNGWSFAVLAASIVLDLWRGRKLHRIGKEQGSQAFEASALHFFADMSSAFVALIGLALVKYAGIAGADDWAALLLSGFVATLSIRLGKRAIDGLTDRYASPEEYKRIRSVIEETPGIESVVRLRVRPVGPSLFVEVGIDVNRILPFAAIERIISQVKLSINEVVPQSDITVHWYPIRTDSEAPFDTLKVIVAQFGILPHNIELAELPDGSIVLDYHLEFQPGISLLDAEGLGHEITESIKKELPNVKLIFSHLEEERSDRSLPVLHEISAEHGDWLTEIKNMALAIEPVKSVSNVRLYRSGADQSIKLMLALKLPGSLALAQAHDISTTIETALRKRFTELTRIVIHTHPE